MCKVCGDREATEANGLCFDDAEELAALTYQAAIEVGLTQTLAVEAAQRSWGPS